MKEKLGESMDEYEDSGTDRKNQKFERMRVTGRVEVRKEERLFDSTRLKTSSRNSAVK